MTPRIGALIGTLALTAAAATGETHNIHFDGGTVKEYYDQIAQEIPGIRLVVDPDVDVFMMPPVDLPGSSDWEAVFVAASLYDGVDAEFISGPREAGEQRAAGTYVVRAKRQAVEDELDAFHTFDLAFPGGSLGSFAAELRRATGANIVVQPAAEGVPVPPVTLHDATVEGVLWTLEKNPVSRDDFAVEMFDDGDSAPVFMLRGTRPQHAPPVQTRVYSIAGILRQGTLDAEDLIGAVEVTSELSETPVRVRYHKGTELLIVRGTPTSIELVEQVVDQAAETAHQTTASR